jgi:hypothetical protein
MADLALRREKIGENKGKLKGIKMKLKEIENLAA